MPSPAAPAVLTYAINTQEAAQVSPLLATVPSDANVLLFQPSVEADAPVTRSENPVPAAPDTPSPNSSDPQITLTFLLVSGQRRTLSFPEETTVARVKEILWNTWSAELQGEQPPAPSFLRLLHLGKIWTDDVRLVDIHLSSTPQQPAVVHLSVRPFIPPDNNGPGSKKRRSKRTNTLASTGPTANTDGADTSANSGCCCIIC